MDAVHTAMGMVAAPTEPGMPTAKFPATPPNPPPNPNPPHPTPPHPTHNDTTQTGSITVQMCLRSCCPRGLEDRV